MNETKNIIPYELQDNDFFLNMIAVDLSNDNTAEADHHKQQIKNIVKMYYQGATDTYKALKQIHHVLIDYDYNVVIPREENTQTNYIVIYNPDDEIEKFIKENFYEEQIFPTKTAIYYEIGLNRLGVKNLNGGKQKKVVESTVKQYADIQPVENSKRKQQIIEIYEVPHYIEKEDRRGKRGKFRDQLIPISVNWLLDKVTNEKSYEQDGETVIYTNVNELAYNFSLISANYKNVSNNKLEEINPKFKPYVVSQFYYFITPQVKSRVFSTLDILQDEYRVISYYRNYLITTKDNKTFISDKSHDKIIRKAERTILKEMGYSNLSFVFRAKKENEFYKKVAFYINTNYNKNWQRYKQQIEIHIDNEGVKEINSQLDSTAEFDISKRKKLLAVEFGDSVYSNIQSKVKSQNKKANKEEKELIKSFSHDIQALLDCEVISMNDDIYPLYQTKDGRNEIKPYCYPDCFLPTIKKLMIIMLP